MPTLILLRHGESAWNKENRFTGWTDVDLSEAGRAEARQAGELLKSEALTFDVAYTSYQKRAIRTLALVQEATELDWVPVIRDWRLNERHYGGLQGLNKAETAAQYGDEQVKRWRRSTDERPPLLEPDDPRHPRFEAAYRDVEVQLLPRGESLRDVVTRVQPCWDGHIAPDLLAGKCVLIAAHGNSLRSIVWKLDGLTDEQVIELNIPTGIPLVYELDVGLRPLSHRYLGDPAAIAAAAAKVASQGKSQGPTAA